MSVVSTAAALVGARAAQTQTMLALGFMKQNADQAAALAAMVEAASQQIDTAAKAAPAGMGQRADITV